MAQMCMRTEEGSWTYGRAPNPIDISSWGSLTNPSKHWHGANLFIRLFRETAHLVAFYDTLVILDFLTPPPPHAGPHGGELLVSRFLTIFDGCIMFLYVSDYEIDIV